MIENIPPLLLRKLWILNLFCKTHHTPLPHSVRETHPPLLVSPPPFILLYILVHELRDYSAPLVCVGCLFSAQTSSDPKSPKFYWRIFPTSRIFCVQHVKPNFMFLSSSIRISPPLNKSNFKKISEESHQISSSNMRQNKVFCGLEFFRFEMLKVTKQPSQHN